MNERPSHLPAKPLPNILWICTDSQRWDTLGCYGNRFVRTPNIDRLAAGGVLFENAYCQNPLCTPSRGSFLTGRYPVTNRLRQNGQICPEDLVLVTRLLADQQYVCGLSGKLHLSPCDSRLTLGSEWWRYQEKYWWHGGAEKRIDDGYSVFHWDHAPGNFHRSSEYTQWLIGKGVDPETIRSPREGCPGVYKGPPSELHQTTWCVDRAIEFLKSHNDGGYSWLFSVNVFDPHFFSDPPEDYLARYLPMVDELPLPNYVEGELANKPAHHGQFDKGPKALCRANLKERDHRMLKAAYWAMCDHIDTQVGRLMDALDKSGQRDNTLVIFTSDHGELLGDHGRYIKGAFLYEGAVHVPLIINMPGTVKSGVRTKALVELTDIAPTLMEVSGQKPHAGMQGKSLWPLLTGKAPTGKFREDVYCEYYNSNPDQPHKFITMVQTDRHKLAVLHGTGEGELYDLEADPCESRNLWYDPAARDLKLRMFQRLSDRQAQTCDPLPPRIGVF